jgi:ribosome-associated protein
MNDALDFRNTIEKEVVLDFIRSSGPGGQNVNKVATAVQLRFDVNRSLSLTGEQKSRLKKLAGDRMTEDGWLVITARRYRSQEKNREDALNRLQVLLWKAGQPPKTRRKTRPTRSSIIKRLEDKRLAARKKQERKNASFGED